MIHFLKDWVLNIVTLVMFLVLLEIILPSGKLKKLINLVSGFILIIALIKPFGGLIRNNVNLEEFQIINTKLINQKELEYNSKVIEEEHMKQVTEIYKKRLIGSIIERLKKVDGIHDVEAEIIIDEDYSSQTFGEVRKAFIKFNSKEEEETDRDTNKDSVIKIEKIKISEDDNSDARQIVDENIKEEIETIVSKLLEISKEDIIISEKG